MREKLQALGQRWRWLGRVLRVQQRYSELNGNQLAAAISLAGFISLFPLLLVAIAVLGFFSHQSVDWRLTSSTVWGSPARRRRSFLASFGDGGDRLRPHPRPAQHLVGDALPRPVDA